MTQPTASGTLRVQVRGPEAEKGTWRRQRTAGSSRHRRTTGKSRSGWRKEGYSKKTGGSDTRVGRKEQTPWGNGKKGVGGVIPPGNLESFVQQAGELQDWARVHGVLKGTSLFCYRQPEDADTGEEPLFTIAINKVMGPLVVKLPGARAQECLLQVPGGWVQRDEVRPAVPNSATPSFRARSVLTGVTGKGSSH